MFMFNAASGNYGPNLIIGYHFFFCLCYSSSKQLVINVRAVEESATFFKN